MSGTDLIIGKGRSLFLGAAVLSRIGRRRGGRGRTRAGRRRSSRRTRWRAGCWLLRCRPLGSRCRRIRLRCTPQLLVDQCVGNPLLTMKESGALQEPQELDEVAGCVWSWRKISSTGEPLPMASGSISRSFATPRLGKRAAPSGSSAIMPAAGSVTSGKTASMLTCCCTAFQSAAMVSTSGRRLGSIPLPRVPENASKVHCPEPHIKGEPMLDCNRACLCSAICRAESAPLITMACSRFSPALSFSRR